MLSSNIQILDKQPLLARGSGEVLLQDWEHHGSQLSKGTLDSLDFPTDLRSLEVAFCRQRHAQTPAHFSMKVGTVRTFMTRKLLLHYLIF